MKTSFVQVINDSLTTNACIDMFLREKMKIPANIIDQLVTSAQSDIMQVLNMLSTWKLSSDAMDFNESKAL